VRWSFCITSVVSQIGASITRRRAASDVRYARVRVAVNRVMTAHSRSASDAATVPENRPWLSSIQGVSRVASSQPPSSQIHRNRFSVKCASASPKENVMLTAPSAAGYVHRSLNVPKSIPSPDRCINGQFHASLSE
jgi:hypothetical protein